MSKKLENRVAIITGGARGMGASHARRFVEEGAKVIITDVLEKEGRETAESLGKNVLFVRHDVTQSDQWEEVVDAAGSTFGPVNILVNNAGIAQIKPFEDTTEEDYLKVIHINQVSVFLGMKAVVNSMKKTKNGSIVNISSIDGLMGMEKCMSYVASKFAVRGMTKVAALELAKYGIRVNSIHPGIIETPMTRAEDVVNSMALLDESFLNTIPLKRPAQPEEVSNMVLFLASDDSGYCTGSEFVIDGGLTPF